MNHTESYPHANYDTETETLTVITAVDEQGRWWIPNRDNNIPPLTDFLVRLNEQLSSSGWTVVGNWQDIADIFTAPLVNAQATTFR